ncbi:MAG: cupin domain-containing protein [Silicimonas sp.]|nr:cupin domain-containing protein [Silicimonas sp.]
MEVSPVCGSSQPEADEGAEGVQFIVEATATLTVDGQEHLLEEGGFAYLPPTTAWTLHNRSKDILRFHWICKTYDAVSGLAYPDVVITNEKNVAPTVMPETDCKWATRISSTTAAIVTS